MDRIPASERTRERLQALLGGHGKADDLRARMPAQVERAVDQTDVTVGLRKIAQHAAGQRIELFGEQTDIIAAREQKVSRGGLCQNHLSTAAIRASNVNREISAGGAT
jgi:predicted RNase H-like nuclease (RuvC/YqgF family)